MVPPTTLPAFDPAIVKKLGPKGVALLEIAASVCAPAVAPGKGGALLVGCRSCPPFTAETGPDGTVRVGESTERGEFYELEHATFGSFTKPGVDEVAATFKGCESHAENWGGTLFAQRIGHSKVWVARSYRSGFHPEACKPFALPDKRDLLLCTWSTGHQGFESELFDSYDFAVSEGDEKGWQRIFALGDDTFASCTMGVIPGRSVVAGSIDRFSILPGTSGASASIQLDVTFGSLLPNKAFKQRCDALTAELDKDRPVTVDVRSVIPRKKHRLTVIWDGKGFSLDAASAAAWEAVQPVQPPEP